MRWIKVVVFVPLIAFGSLPAGAMDANSLIQGTLTDWFNAKSDITLQAAQIMVARDQCYPLCQ
jgi:hypothetical protein